MTGDYEQTVIGNFRAYCSERQNTPYGIAEDALGFLKQEMKSFFEQEKSQGACKTRRPDFNTHKFFEEQILRAEEKKRREDDELKHLFGEY
jgi:hypothetical protein